MFCRLQSRPSLLTRTTASLMVVLVLALTALASSPELHSRLHVHPGLAGPSAHHDSGAPGQAPGDEGCVVTLFAQGLVLCLALLALASTGRTPRFSAAGSPERIGPPAPGYLHLPPQAPPARAD